MMRCRMNEQPVPLLFNNHVHCCTIIPLIRVCQYSQLGWIIKFENKARKNYKPQYTNVFEDLEFLQ